MCVIHMDTTSAASCILGYEFTCITLPVTFTHDSDNN